MSKMMSSQLGRALLAGSDTPDDDPPPTDGQVATPDDRGSYGELMEVIDRILSSPEDQGGSLRT
jgi:hypothetical protein